MTRKSRWIMGVVLAAVVGVAPFPVSLGKPPDLPVDERISCPDGHEPGEFRLKVDLTAGGLSVHFGIFAPKKAAAPVTLDAVCPCLLPALMERLVQFISPRTGGETEECEAPRPQAARLFSEGERCRRAGDLQAARIRYQEAHLLDPTSHEGQRAIQRLLELEMNEDASEEQEEPARPKPSGKADDRSERTYSRVRETTQPLGTVEIESY